MKRIAAVVLVLLLAVVQMASAQVQEYSHSPHSGNPIFVSQSLVNQSISDLSGYHKRFEVVNSDQFDRKQAIHDFRHEIEAVQKLVFRAKVLLNNQPVEMHRSINALEMTHKKLTAAQVLIITNEKYLLESSDSQIKMMEYARLSKLMYHSLALLSYSQMALSKWEEESLEPNVFFVQAQKALKKAEDNFFIIYDQSISENKDEVLIEIIQQKLLEAHLALLKAQVSNGKDKEGVSFESRKYLLETKQTIATTQNLLFNLEYEWRKDTLPNKINEAFLDAQVWMEWARGSLNLGEANIKQNLLTLPVTEEKKPVIIEEDEKGVTQEHIIQTLNSLVETQELLIKTIDMIPQAHAEKTQNIALQVQSQQMILQSVEEDIYMQESVVKTQQMLDETEEYISSTRKVAEKYPDSTITYRQYLAYFDYLLEETNRALEETQALIKESDNVQKPQLVLKYDEKEKNMTQDQKAEVDHLVEKMLIKVEDRYVVEVYPAKKKKIRQKRGDEVLTYLYNKGISKDRLFIKYNDEQKDKALYNCIVIKNI